MLSGLLLGDLLRTTLWHHLPILCMSDLSYYSHPSSQRPVSLISYHTRKKHEYQAVHTEAFSLGKHLAVHAGDGSSLVSFLIHRHINILIPWAEEPLTLHTTSAATQFLCRKNAHVNETNLHRNVDNSATLLKTIIISSMHQSGA